MNNYSIDITVDMSHREEEEELCLGFSDLEDEHSFAIITFGKCCLFIPVMVIPLM